MIFFYGKSLQSLDANKKECNFLRIHEKVFPKGMEVRKNLERSSSPWSSISVDATGTYFFRKSMESEKPALQ